MTGSGLGLTTGSGQRPIESHVLEIFCVSLRVSQSQITIRERNLDADLPAPRCQLLMKRKNLGFPNRRDDSADGRGPASGVSREQVLAVLEFAERTLVVA